MGARSLTIVAIVSGTVGVFTVIRGQSFAGEALADISTTGGSATLVYQVDRSNGIVSISPIDITTSSGLSTLTSALAAGPQVKVYGTPQTDGTYKAYVLMYFTNTEPAD